MENNIIEKLKQSGLTGRSGSGFPVWQKWQSVKDALGDKKYVICNGSEGEPGSSKDKHILKNWPEEVINGMKIAMETVGADTGYIYLNEDYYKNFKESLAKIIGNLPIEFARKPHGYLAGEETVILEVIEGKRPEPRLKPPYPTEVGLFGKPTLINNVETFYQVSKIYKGEYTHTKFYSISGDIPNPGVFELPENLTIKQILQQTENFPFFNFFVQAGGGACGAIILPNELNQPIRGLACLIVFDKNKTKPLKLMKQWIKFLLESNCDKCTPCREGLFRISEMLEKEDFNKTALQDIFDVLQKTSFCPLGRLAYLPFKTAMEKLF